MSEEHPMAGGKKEVQGTGRYVVNGNRHARCDTCGSLIENVRIGQWKAVKNHAGKWKPRFIVDEISHRCHCGKWGYRA